MLPANFGIHFHFHTGPFELLVASIVHRVHANTREHAENPQYAEIIQRMIRSWKICL
jgi:hypothetical protein